MREINYVTSFSNSFQSLLRRSVHHFVLYSAMALHPIAIGFTQTLSLPKRKLTPRL
jgi:hypothetical protein